MCSRGFFMGGLALLREEGVGVILVLFLYLIGVRTVPTWHFNLPFPSAGRADLQNKTASAANGTRFSITVFFGIAVALGARL
jgi:hypothetical protein